MNRLICNCLPAWILLSASLASGSDLSLREEFNGQFLIGAALNTQQILGNDQASPEFIAQQFSALTLRTR